MTRFLVTIVAVLISPFVFAADPEPLPSWIDSGPKQAIVQFVGKVATEGSPDFVPLAERIAVFDNDGTLWAERPMYFQVVHHTDAAREYAYDRESHVGKLARGLEEGPKRGWTIVSMKNDWKRIYSATE